MNEYVSDLQHVTRSSLENVYRENLKKGQDEIKKIILMMLGVNTKIISNPRAFNKISTQMDEQLVDMDIKKEIDGLIDSKDIEFIIDVLAKRGWKAISKDEFSVPANTNRYFKGRKKVQVNYEMKEYRKETRYRLDKENANCIDINSVTILRHGPCTEDEFVIVGNLITKVDERGVDISKIDSRFAFNKINAFNLADYLAPSEDKIKSLIKEISKRGNDPIKSHNGFLKGKCLIFNRYPEANEGAGQIEYHDADDEERTHEGPVSVDLTSMKGDIARLSNINLKMYESGKMRNYYTYLNDINNRREVAARFETKKQESETKWEFSKEER